MTHDELKAKTEAIVAAHAQASEDAAEKLAQALALGRDYLEERKAASTRDWLAHQALIEGRNA